MVKKLKKRISILVFFLFGSLLIGGLVVLNWMNYRSEVFELKSSFRQEIQEIGWKNFLEGNADGEVFEETDYCILRLEPDGGVRLTENHFTGKSEEQLIRYGEKIVGRLREGRLTRSSGHFRGVVFLLKISGRRGKNLVLISAASAYREILPFVGASAAVGVLGMALLMLAARKLSQWQVGPVEESMRAEKDFMINASHELKTPLTVIGANLELLSEEIGENRHLEYIRQESGRMLCLVNQMLTLVRLETPMLERPRKKFRVDYALLEIVCPMESVAYEKRQRLDIQIQENMSIFGDEEQFKSLASILLDNAISYTPEGGSITVKAALSAHNICLRFVNTGEPIAEEEQKKLFERFYRQDKARGGEGEHFGLGLPIAASIVANHHGTIQVESAGGQNTFTVMLPAARR